MLKAILLAMHLSTPNPTIDNEKIMDAIEILKGMEEATFVHQDTCEFSRTEYCTCDGNYLALIAYNRIVKAKKILTEAIPNYNTHG